MYGHLPSPAVYPLRYSPTLSHPDTDVHTFVHIGVSVAHISHVFTERTVNVGDELTVTSIPQPTPVNHKVGTKGPPNEGMVPVCHPRTKLTT